MLEVTNIISGYNKNPVIKDVSFSLAQGEKLCIIGPNGCGKSTLLKTIVGLNSYQGEIKLLGRDMRSFSRREAAQKLAFLDQQSAVYFSYTVFEAVSLGRYATTNSRLSHLNKVDKTFIEKCLNDTNIFHLKDKQITQLSGGELQRVMLAKVFVQEPSIILLDEPTNHLDLKNQIELMENLTTWVQIPGRAAVTVLHDINLALGFADRIILMSDGKIVFDGQPNELIDSSVLKAVYGIDVGKYMRASLSSWS